MGNATVESHSAVLNSSSHPELRGILKRKADQVQESEGGKRITFSKGQNHAHHAERRNIRDEAVSSTAEDIHVWLQSFGVAAMMQYETVLNHLYENVSQIRDLYEDSMEAFFEDCRIHDVAHQALFKAAIQSHIGLHLGSCVDV